MSEPVPTAPEATDPADFDEPQERRPGPALTAAVVTGAGAIATLAIAATIGTPDDEMVPLAVSLIPAFVLSVVFAAIAARMLSGASIRRRALGVVLVASIVGLANLMILASLMYLVGTEAGELGVLLLYSTAAGVGAAFALTRSCLLYTSPSPRDGLLSRMPSSA